MNIFLQLIQTIILLSLLSFSSADYGGTFVKFFEDYHWWGTSKEAYIRKLYCYNLEDIGMRKRVSSIIVPAPGDSTYLFDQNDCKGEIVRVTWKCDHNLSKCEKNFDKRAASMIISEIWLINRFSQYVKYFNCNFVYTHI